MSSVLRTAAIGLIWAAALPALAGPQRAAVLQELSGIEDAPTAESLRALGDAVPQELVELAADPSLRSSVRARALHALGWFPSAETRTVLEAALVGDNKLMARKAAYALANGWSAEAIPALGRALSAADPQLRNAAARALGNIEDDAVVTVLDARLTIEDQPAVREAIESSLSRRR